MSEAKHLDGPLTLHPYGRITGGPLLQFTNGKAQEQIAAVMGLSSGDDPGSERDANARRIVACWNACQGVETWLMEQYPAAFSKLREERDEFLDALFECKRAAEYAAQYSHIPDAREEIAAAIEHASRKRDAAIAKATGQPHG